MNIKQVFGQPAPDDQTAVNDEIAKEKIEK